MPGRVAGVVGPCVDSKQARADASVRRQTQAAHLCGEAGTVPPLWRDQHKGASHFGCNRSPASVPRSAQAVAAEADTVPPLWGDRQAAVSVGRPTLWGDRQAAAFVGRQSRGRCLRYWEAGTQAKASVGRPAQVDESLKERPGERRRSRLSTALEEETRDELRGEHGVD